MPDSDLRRSIRRGVAVLLVPLSLLLVQVQVVVVDHLGDGSPLPGVSRAVGYVCLTVAGLYLLGSAARQLNAAADWPL
jgi:hypothetical protein